MSMRPFLAVAVLGALGGTQAAYATPFSNVSVSAYNGGGACNVTSRYQFSSGGDVQSSADPCTGSVTPAAAGATSVSLSATATGGSFASETYGFATGHLSAYITGSAGVAGTPMRDTINFVNSNAGAVVVGLLVRLSGTLAVESGFGNAWDVGAKIVLGSSDLNYQYHYDYNNGTQVNQLTTDSYDPGSGSTVHGSSALATSATAVINPGFSTTLEVLLDPGMNPLVFQEDLNAGGARGVLDLSHTFQVGLVIPDGVTYSSDSGFLSASTPLATVSEPGALALLGGGFLGIIGLRRRAPSS
ncbi:MAG TPA: PEP-CTERM sorting domain-containing protein [Alphaproteobacteria bacterium]|nr:PEP-CTERM sorting domain-containing protein [Alphaproteobacteria bacterium]